jgi:outer membrane receptor protein involved in Fe transport
LAYVNAELSEDAPQLAGGAAKDGDRLPGTPEWQGSFVAEYLTTLQRGLELGVGYSMTVQSDVFTKLGNGSDCCRIDNGTLSGQGQELSGFALHNASFTVARDKWEAMLYVNNLADKYAETGVRNDPSFLVSSIEPAGFTYRRHAKYMAQPRTIGLDFRYRTAF